MSIVSAIIAAGIATLLHLNGPSDPPPGTGGSGTQGRTHGGNQGDGTAVDYSGTYIGQAYNGGLIGSVQLQVNRADSSSGATTAEIRWSGQLNGAGPVRGTFSTNTITFTGEVASASGPWSLEMPCTFSGSSNVTCDYQLQALAPNTSFPQQGSLTATRS